MTTQVLLIGDFHIPYEAEKVPDKFLQEAKNSDIVICTGDFVSNEVLEKLMDISEDLRAVKGEEDYLDLPEQDLISIEDMKFGLIHGHQIEDEKKARETERPEREKAEEEEKGRLDKLV